MKKFFLIAVSLLLALSCTCNREQKEETAEFNVENLVKLDREYMSTIYEKYVWFETCVVLKEVLTSGNNEIEGVSSIFQVSDSTETGIKTIVVSCAHVADTSSVEVKEGFWVEDQPMEPEMIKVTFEEAFERMIEANYPKPESRQVVLRKQLGPIPCNPQYIFGNVKYQIYVDATTGDVTDKNPAFKGFEKDCSK